ncbi:MAG: DNA polymerase III subunit alpha [Candidatus Anammoxibacter sp.]
MATSYAPLLLRSNYSLLTGTASIDDILKKASAFGIKSIALTDTNNLYGAIPFYKKAKEYGIKPIIGVELVLEPDNLLNKEQRIVLLARNTKGYSNICRIITLTNLDFRLRNSDLKSFSNPPIPPFSKVVFCDFISRITEHQEGVYFLTEHTTVANQLVKHIDKKFIKLLIIRPNQSIHTQRHIYSQAKEIGVDVVGNCNIYFLEKDDYNYHKLLTAIKENRLVSEDCTPFTGKARRSGFQPDSWASWKLALRACATSQQQQSIINRQSSITNPNAYFRSPHEMAMLFTNCPELLKNSLTVADDCNVEIPMGRYIFPKYPLPKEESSSEYLYTLCKKGLKWRYNTITKEIRDRLQHELNVINKLGFPGYFLVVGDIVSFARSRNIPVVGRGSGASSIVAYALGITNVDPIKYNLCFERFMHPLRKDYPDLDIDFCWRGRDEVINYVYKTYGSNHVAMISTHNTFQPRSAFREVAKAYGIPNNVVNKYSKFIPHRIGFQLSDIANEIPVFKEFTENHSAFKKIIKMADRLNGHPRHLGIHSGGVVISNKPIDSYVPLERSSKGIVITQYDMRAIEDIGLIKIDLLGNRALSTIRETINLVKEEHNITIDQETIPDKDPATVKLLKNGQTLGCFQIESPGMRNLLKMLEVSSIDETIASLSLIRPGPAAGGLKERYVKRARGLEKTTHIDPRLKEVLKNSYGIMLYEEDAIRSASAVAGISLAEGDEFRRSIAKANTNDKLDKIVDKFIKQAGNNGVKPDVARRVGKYIGNFAEYTFCKAHAAGYGFLAYQGVYLKAHYPVEFIVGLLNNHQGMYEKRVHIEEARRTGIAILHPCVNRSEQEYTIENGKIRVGLMQIKGLSLKVIDQIIVKRLFSSLSDFLRKVKASQKETESLISCGAFDFTGETRPQLMWKLTMRNVDFRFGIAELGLRNAGCRLKSTGQNANGQTTMLNLKSETTNSPVLNDYQPERKFWDEYKALEIFINHHPMVIFKRNSTKNGFIDSRALHANTGKKIRISGILDAIRKTDTKRNERMMFVTLEDEKGVFEVTLFPSVYKKYSYLLKDYGPYIIEGKVENQYGAITITAERILKDK